MDAAQYEYFQNELNRLLARRNEIKGRIGGLSTVLTQLTNQLGVEKRNLATYIAERDKLNNKIKEYEAMKASLEELSSSLRSVHGSLISAKDALGNLIQGDSVKKETISGEINTKMDTVWNYYSAILRITNEASSKIADLKEAFTKKQTAVINANSAINNLNKEIEDKQTEITFLNQDLNVVEESIRFYSEQI